LADVLDVTSLRSWAKVTQSSSSGDLRIQLKAGDSILYQTAFTPSFYLEIAGTEADGEIQRVLQDETIVNIIVPTTLGGDDRYQERTLIVEDLANGVTLADMTIDPDHDMDGVPEAKDLCPNTPPGSTVDEWGCVLDVDEGRADSDFDGIANDNDACPDTKFRCLVDDSGCAVDSDGDGVCDGLDICPGYDDAIDSDGDGTPDGCDAAPSPDDEGGVASWVWIIVAIGAVGLLVAGIIVWRRMVGKQAVSG
jgi:hypothetical protein